MHDNNNNSVIADELEDIALQLAMLDSTNVNNALNTVANEVQRIEILSELLELPALQSISHWIISNTQVTEENESQLKTLLTEGHFSTWIEVLAAFLREYDSSLIATLKTEFTKPKWLFPIPLESLENLLSWLDESTKACDNKNQVDISLSSLTSIDQPLFETEKTSLSLFESNTGSSSIDDLLVTAEKNTNNDLSILAELSGKSLNKENNSSDIDVDIIDIIDSPIIDKSIKDQDTNDTANSSEHQSKQVRPAEAEEYKENNDDNELSNFTTEIDDIIMTLSTIDTSKGIIENTDKYIHEIQRLNLLAELSNYPVVTKASEWFERNIMALSTDKSEDSENFITSGECWTWLELTSACLNNPDDISLLPAVSAELMREDWAEVFPVEDLQSFILFLQDPTTQESTFSDQLTEQKNQTLIESNDNDNVENEKTNKLSLKWDDDVHPELLSVFFQETPEQISEVAALLLTISKSEADTEQHQHAARIAHTIKGASGVVGIGALVQFTHKLEDILDYSVTHKLPPETADLLAEASDCLESLFEAVQDQQAAPEEFLPVLEKLTATTNKLVTDEIDETPVATLDISELPDFITNSNKSKNSPSKEKPSSNVNKVNENNSLPNKPSESAKEIETNYVTPVFSTEVNSIKTPSTTPQEKQLNNIVNEAHVRVPLSIIDKLLNLAGELSITATRISDELDKAIDTNKLTKQQDGRVHEMLNELSTTIYQQENNQSENIHSQLKNSSLDSLEMDSYNELHSISGLLTESILDGEEIDTKLTYQLKELRSQLSRQNHLNKELSDVILSSRMVSIDTLVPRLERTVRQTCRTTGKKAKLVITGNNINVDNDIINGLTDPLLHLLRNAVDHGIEDSQKRQNIKKKEQGTIKLDFSRQGNFIIMKLHDDGAGINPDIIYQRAIDKGLITPEQSFSKDEALKLILLPGFTTQNSISSISGRGVGMDVVKTNVEKLKGTIDIKSTPNKGSTFTIKIPLTLVTSGTLLLETANNQVAVPVDSIEQLIYLSPKDVIHKRDAQYIKYKKKEILIQALPNLLTWPSNEIDYSRAQSIIIVKSNNKIHAVQVEKIINSRELVIKTLDPWFNNTKGIIGACHLADGSVAPVINLPQLLEAETKHTIKQRDDDQQQVVQKTQNITKDIPQILVVDDSLSNRKALSLIIEQLDYDVLTAVDGLDALNIINDKHIDMVFTDLEMPRMNGLELTQAIRVWDDKKSLPIVMITSRTTNKHRDLAEKAGVDDYLTKPVVTEDLHAALARWLEKVSLV